jgi:hypothetical protein
MGAKDRQHHSTSAREDWRQAIFLFLAYNAMKREADHTQRSRFWRKGMASKARDDLRHQVEPTSNSQFHPDSQHCSTKNLKIESDRSALPLSQRFAGQLLMFSQSAPSPQTKLVAQSIVAKRDRLIRVDVGGTKKVGRKYGGEAIEVWQGQGTASKVKLQPVRFFGELNTDLERRTDSIGRAYSNRFKAPYNKARLLDQSGGGLLHANRCKRICIDIVQGIIKRWDRLMAGIPKVKITFDADFDEFKA